MNMASLALSVTIAVLAVALLTLLYCRSRVSRNGVDPIVGLQRHGRTYYVPRSLLEEHQPDGVASALTAAGRVALLVALGSALLVAAFVRFA
ncbi:MAG TPA: hypothetical protein PK593_02595 [Thermomicrobiales bacterium]|nr:hypothetical protein [Chloroflexota bacterium]HQX62328.1 hypothetical protein [Thermomicrobiales bacterium]